MNFLGKLVRIFVYITYPILIILLVAGAAVFVYRNNQYNSTQDQVNNLQAQIDSNSQHVDALNSQITELNNSNAELQGYINTLEDSKVGTISGKIFPFVTADSKDFTQYQRVCAQSTTNSNEQYCRTVSAITQTYQMSLPEGTYQVYAEVFPTPNNSFASYRGTYSEYVKCVQEKPAAQCDSKTLTKPINISVKSNTDTANIDPVDWQKH